MKTFLRDILTFDTIACCLLMAGWVAIVWSMTE